MARKLEIRFICDAQIHPRCHSVILSSDQKAVWWLDVRLGVYIKPDGTMRSARLDFCPACARMFVTSLRTTVPWYKGSSAHDGAQTDLEFPEASDGG